VQGIEAVSLSLSPAFKIFYSAISDTLVAAHTPLASCPWKCQLPKSLSYMALSRVEGLGRIWGAVAAAAFDFQ
jgi:hypothetical protein